MPTTYSKTIWDFLVSKLGNEYGAAGAMGNLQAESNLQPNIVQGDIPISSYSVNYTAKVDSGAISEYDFVHNGPNGGGYGLAQWTYYTRKQGLYDMKISGGYSSIGNIHLALNYLYYELQTLFPGVLSTLKNATSVREASDCFLHDFENPADQSTSVEQYRASLGTHWYELYTGSTPSDPDTPGGDEANPVKKKMPLWLLLAASKRR